MRAPADATDLDGPAATGLIVTERLTIRRFTYDDLAAFAAYRSDPDVARYQSWDVPYRPSDSEAFLESQRRPELLAPGFWRQLAVCGRVSGELRGDCAVHLVPDQPRTAEVGVTFAPASQGRGLATEALGAVVSWLFGEQGLHRVFAGADERNEGVHRLLTRLGLRHEATLVEADWFKAGWTTLRIYAVLAREWPVLADPPARPA